MNVSARMDVVFAEPTPQDPPAARVIFLARTKAAGAEEARALGIEPVAIITPRSLDAARGITADEIVASADLDPEESALLNEHAAPSLATTQVETVDVATE